MFHEGCHRGPHTNFLIGKATNKPMSLCRWLEMRLTIGHVTMKFPQDPTEKPDNILNHLHEQQQ